MSRNADSAQGLFAWLLACSRGTNLDEELYEKVSLIYSLSVWSTKDRVDLYVCRPL
jgi:hypothetical protein